MCNHIHRGAPCLPAMVSWGRAAAMIPSPISEWPLECQGEPFQQCSPEVLWPSTGPFFILSSLSVLSVTTCRSTGALGDLTLFPRLQVEAHGAMPPPPVTGGLTPLPPLCPIHQAPRLRGRLTSPATEHTKVLVPQILQERCSLPQITSLIFFFF